MPPTVASGSGRRKSFAFFSRPTILAESETTTWTTKDDIVPVRARPKSLFAGVNGFSEVSTTVTPAVPSTRRVLTKSSQRPKSMFGSLKGRELEPASPTVTNISSASSSLEDSSASDVQWTVLPFSTIVIHAGEVVTGGNLLRKKKEYMVLTNRELLKYKTEAKANEAFGMGSRNSYGRSFSMISPGDHASEHTLITPMNHVIAIFYPGSENERGTVVQVDYLDGPHGLPSSTTLTTSSRTEAQIWVDKLRSVSTQAQLSSPPPAFPDSTVEHVARRLEADRDYSPMHFQIFRVVQRLGKSGNKSAEDLHKMYSTMCYLAIGIHKVHIVPFRPVTNRSTASLAPAPTNSFGILNLMGIWLASTDNCFSLTFRLPCRYPQIVNLASTDAPDIIQSIRQASEYLRPMWQIDPFSTDIPDNMKDDPLPDIPPTPGDDLNGFDRTLAAYCTAYDLDASNIVYAVQMHVEDGPQFQLYPPAHSRRRQYTDLELLAVMRTLRWNDSFCSISFRGISLDCLTTTYDAHGSEYEPRIERSGRPINLKTLSQGMKPLLTHELRALALYCGKLRRMDFHECIRNRGEGGGLLVEAPSDVACPIVEAIMPLCRRGLTNVDWFNLTGIELGEGDLDWLVDAAASRLAHFRGFELQRCGLTERMLTLFLNALTTHENTLEALDISGNPCRMHAPALNNSMVYFPFLRKLNLSRLLRTTGEDPVLTAETLHRWRLEELDLSETKLNAETVEAIAAYLMSPQSDGMQHLALTRCSLSAKDVALLMCSMERIPGRARDLHLYVGQNSLAHDANDLVDCIAKGRTPSYLTMRMVDYPREEPFQELVRALTVNKTIVYLDMSKISLPYEAGEKTSLLLEDLFAKNTTLRELDISGEQAVLESASLGAGLLKPLGRIAENKCLEVLRIELQSLGTRGAMELASMIPNNNTLREIHCEMNDIHLNGFTALVNAVERNHTLIYLPRMDRDRSDQLRALKEKLCQPTTPEWEQPEKPEKKSSFRRSSKAKKVTFSEGDAMAMTGVDQDLALVEEKWESEAIRLQSLLTRNVTLRVHERNKNKRAGVNSSSSISSMGLLWGVDAR